MMKTAVKWKNGLQCLIICCLFMFTLSCKTVWAQDNVEIEQIYVNMPEITIGIRNIEGVDLDGIEVYRNQDVLENISVELLQNAHLSQTWFVLLDVSKSINAADFDAAKEAVARFADELPESEKMILITFGDNVEIILDGTEEKELIQEKISALSRTGMNTQLYEAISKVAQIQDMESSFVKKNVIVITDGIDAASLGNTTMQEAAAILTRKGLPVYGLAVEYGEKESVNSFGEFSRSTGGKLRIWKSANIEQCLVEIREEIQKLYLLKVRDKSNQVSYTEETITVNIPKKSQTFGRSVYIDTWQKDTEAPKIVSAKQKGNRKIEVIFSEAIEGMAAAANYQLENESGLLVPVSVEVINECEVELAFREDFFRGTYQLSGINMTDVSMESNPLTGSMYLELDGLEPETEETNKDIETVPVEIIPEKTPLLWIHNWGWVVIMAILVILLLVGVLLLKKVKEKKHLVVVEKEQFYVDEVSTRKHVVVQQEPVICVKLYPKSHLAKQKVIEHRFSNSIIVGRSDICDIYFDDTLMSRQHFLLEYAEQKMLLTDLETVNGTFVNGVKVIKTRVLQQDDVISAGTMELMIRWEEG